MGHRDELLDDAKQLIMSDRNNSYGPPHQDFTRVAEMLSSLGFRPPNGMRLTAHHVAMIMVVLKVSRLVWGPLHRDSWVDIAGYAACGHEAAVLTLGEEAPVDAEG